LKKDLGNSKYFVMKLKGTHGKFFKIETPLFFNKYIRFLEKYIILYKFIKIFHYKYINIYVNPAHLAIKYRYIRGENGPRVTRGQSRAGRYNAHEKIIPSNNNREAIPVLRNNLRFTTVGQIICTDQFGYNFTTTRLQIKSLK